MDSGRQYGGSLLNRRHREHPWKGNTMLEAFAWTIGLIVAFVLIVGVIKGVRDSRKGGDK